MKDKTHLSYITDIMAAADLATEGTRALIAMESTPPPPEHSSLSIKRVHVYHPCDVIE